MGLFVDPASLRIKPVQVHPWKVVIIDVTPETTVFDIEQALIEACQKRKIVITNVELFQDRTNDRKRTCAFVSLATKDDLDTLLDDSVKTFGVYIHGQRSSIAEVEDKKIISVRGKRAVLEEDIIDFLKSIDIPHEDVDIFLARDRHGEPVGQTYLTFKQHRHAYQAWKSMNDMHELGYEATWVQRDVSVFSKLAKTSDILLSENEEIRTQIEGIAAEQAVLLSKISEKIGDASIQNVDFSYHTLQYNHLMKVLKLTNFDRKQTMLLLKIPAHRFARMTRELREKGYQIDLPETRGRIPAQSF